MNVLGKNTLSISFLVLLCQIFCSQCSRNINNLNEKKPKFILADRETLLMRGYSTSFTSGYIDGCESGQHAAGDLNSVYIKNQQLVDLHKDYLLGWVQGNSFCYEYMRNLIKHSGSTDPLSYQSKEMIEREKARIWSELKK